MKTSQLVLLDANVIIKLFELDLWDGLLLSYHIVISETVRDESHFFRSRDGGQQPIEWDKYAAGGRVRILAASSGETAAFLAKFGQEYADRLDPGELESLVLLLKSPEGSLICSADAIVFRVLALLDMTASGISLQEVLGQVGHNPRLAPHFTKDFRTRHTDRGFEDRLQGFGKKP